MPAGCPSRLILRCQPPTVPVPRGPATTRRGRLSSPSPAGSHPMSDAAGTVPARATDRIDARTWMIAGVVTLGGIMSNIDTTAVNVALDTLAGDFGVPIT